jgi:protein-S-isoprenylcysteine O-methyltransferase Ste14
MKAAFRGLAVIGVMEAILFSAAGRLDWPAAWLVSAFFIAGIVFGGVWMSKHDPELLEERRTAKARAEGWDRALMRGYSILLFVMIVTAALDAGRYRWSPIPPPVQAAGGVALLVAGAIIAWCLVANPFLSSHARIQDDRGQRVVEGGPYRFVRHPMYVGILLLACAIPIALGSAIALVPAALICVVFVVRTKLEDRMLVASLRGYREYAERVHWRLLPGIW